jgi:hypothetical protein
MSRSSLKNILLLLLVQLHLLIIAHLNILINDPPGTPATLSVTHVLLLLRTFTLEYPVELLKLPVLRLAHVSLRLRDDRT